MSKHTSWRLGGPADMYFRPDSVGELCDFLRELDDDVDIHWTGLGSNLLVRDGGIRGVVITPAAALGNLERLDSGRVEGRCRACRARSWPGVARDGGSAPRSFCRHSGNRRRRALKMNAGAFGGETWDSVVEVDTVDRRG